MTSEWQELVCGRFLGRGSMVPPYGVVPLEKDKGVLWVSWDTLILSSPVYNKELCQPPKPSRQPPQRDLSQHLRHLDLIKPSLGLVFLLWVQQATQARQALYHQRESLVPGFFNIEHSQPISTRDIFTQPQVYNIGVHAFTDNKS